MSKKYEKKKKNHVKKKMSVAAKKKMGAIICLIILLAMIVPMVIAPLLNTPYMISSENVPHTHTEIAEMVATDSIAANE